MRISHLVLGVLGCAAPVQAQARLALADVVAEALARNPEIAAAQQRYEAMRQRPLQERSLPDPMVSAGYSSSGRPWPGAGLGSEPTARIGAMVSQQLPYPGKLALKASIAQREADASAQDVEAVRLSVTARVKQAYYRLAYAYAATDVLNHNRELLDTLLKVSESRYAVGQTAQQDVIKAQAQLTMLELQIERLRAERAVREGELAALMARSPSAAPIGRPVDLTLPSFDGSLEALIESARLRAPMLRRESLMVDRSTLAVEAARKEFKPDFGVSGGYYSMGSMPSMYEFRFDVTIPLQRARRVAAVAEQLSAADAAKRGYESARLDLQARIQQDYQMAVSAGRLARLYRDTLLPQARLALESSMTSYQTGAIDFLSVLTSFSSVLEFEMTFYEELAAFHAALSRIEEMTGTPLGE
jgi:outer membrane protein TolC